MSLSLVYLFNRFLYQIKEFLYHWYIGTFRIICRYVLNFLEYLDKIFALKITLRYFLKPLYQDYTLLGYLLGFFFRFWRILLASLIYGILIFVALLIYLIWAGIPIYIIHNAL